jgi:hypothetical protein
MRFILLCILTGLAAVRAAAQNIPIPLTPDRWTSYILFQREPRPRDKSVRFETHLGRPSIVVPSGLAYASGVDFHNGTIDADIATDSTSAFYGMAFHLASQHERYEIVFFRPPGADPTLQYAPSFYDMNAWQFYPAPEYGQSPDFPPDRWVHVRVVVKGLVASIYVDTATTPTLEVHDLALGSIGGTIGIWGRAGGAYISNLTYRPDTTTYPLTGEHTFAPGTITAGWSLSPSFLASQQKPDLYPDIRSLQWQPVDAEREGIVMIGRYRKDPSVEPERPLRDRPATLPPAVEVVFARNTIVSDRDTVRKMWIGYSDDIVVYLNGRPLYAGRNAMVYRDPAALGYFYPYADAVFLPLKKGKNELVLAVSEATAGWGFMARFDQPSTSGAP